MADQEYIILRTEELFSPELAGLGRVGLEPVGVMGVRPRPNVESLNISTATLSKIERDDLRRDPRTQALASPMPLQLIEKSFAFA